MNERTVAGLHIIQAALLVGVVGDMLFGQAGGLGINLGLWTLTLAGVAWWLDHASGSKTLSTLACRWLLPSALFFAALVAWRASGVLRALDLLIVVMLLAFVGAESQSGRTTLPFAGILSTASEAARSVCRTLTGFVPLVFRDVRWREMSSGRWSRHARGVARALAIALPLIIVFGTLFMAADAVFRSLVNNAFAVDTGSLFSHLIVALCLTWLAGGFLRNVFLARTLPAPNVAGVGQVVATGDAALNANATSNVNLTGATATATGANVPAVLREPFRLGTLETVIVLGLLNALFAMFVSVQLRYLFGGAEWVATTSGVTLAEYARGGFFELVTVAALVLPLLLGWHALLRAPNAKSTKTFRVLASLLVMLLCVIMVSAVSRMMLYTDEYGLTQLRFYTTAFMAWLGLALLWFAATVLVRDARREFLPGALISLLVVTFALHIANPDALIVRVNANRVRAERVFDTEYALSLSDDAVPALIESLTNASALTSYERGSIARELVGRDAAYAATDWRAWSVSRAQARRAIAAKGEGLWKLATMHVNETERMDAMEGVTVGE